MPLHMAIGFLYSVLIEGRDEDQLLELDALLGDEEAANIANERKLELVRAMGGEIA